MILIAGGTGFIGQVLVRQLVEMDQPVRLLVRPSKETPKLLTGKPLDIAVSSLQDERGLRAAFRDVDILIHLVSDERRGSKADFEGVDINGTQALLRAASQSRVKQMIYLSYLGADKGSAFAMLKTKSICEESIIHSQVPYTILRSAVTYGPGDQFTNSIYQLIKKSPGFIFLPGDGKTLVQPIFVNDLVACILWTLGNINTIQQIISVGGGEYLTIQEVAATIMEVTGKHRLMIPIPPVYLRTLALTIEQYIGSLPISINASSLLTAKPVLTKHSSKMLNGNSIFVPLGTSGTSGYSAGSSTAKFE